MKTLSLFKFLLFFTVIPLILNGKSDFEKKIEKEFKIASNGKTSINNRYGKVDLKTWDENKVKIKVTIQVEASNSSEAEKIFDRVKIIFNNSNDQVSALTEIESPSKSSWWLITSTVKQNFSINYEVFIPENNSLSLVNKYGNIFVGDIQGQSEINLAYGTGKIQSLKGKSTIDLSYGGLDIQNVTSANISIKYSNLSILQIQSLNLESKYSNINIDRIGRMISESKYDNYKIQNSGSIQLISQYTTLKVEELSDEIKLDLKYGSAKINLTNSFQCVQINGSYADFKIGVGDQSNFKFDVESKYASVKYPSSLNLSTQIERDHQKTIRGIYGNKNTATSTVNIHLNYGGISISELEL